MSKPDARATGATHGDSLLHRDAAAQIARMDQERAELLQALREVVDCDWAYMGQDADTGNPQSLYCRVRRGRAVLERFASESRQDQEMAAVDSDASGAGNA